MKCKTATKIFLQTRKREECDFFLVNVWKIYGYEVGHTPEMDCLQPTSVYRKWIQKLIELACQKPLVLTYRTSNWISRIQQLMWRMGTKQVINHSGEIFSRQRRGL